MARLCMLAGYFYATEAYFSRINGLNKVYLIPTPCTITLNIFENSS